MATDLSLYEVDLTTSQPNGRSGESPRSAFTKYNDLVSELETWEQGAYLGSTEPSSPYAYQQWIDTSSDPVLIKRRDSSNSSWVTIGEYDQTLGTAAGYDATETSSSSSIPLANSDGKIDNSWLDTGDLNTGIPSLSIPFNESGKLDYGVGTEYVSGLPVYGVDFTRSTSCYYINKSGLIDFADVDEIAIGSDGALLHSAITGLFPYSNDISASDWTKANVTVEDDGTLAPYSSSLTDSTAYHIVNSTDDGIAHRITDQTATLTGWVTVCAIVKPDVGYENLRLEIPAGDGNGSRVIVFNTSTLTFDATERDPEDYGYRLLSDGWFLVYIKFYDDTGFTGPNYLYFLPTGTTSNGFSGDGVNGGYVAYYQKFNDNIDPRLLCVTDGSSSTITATSCTVPVSGNLPAAGESFTIVCDSYVDGSSSVDNYGRYYSVGTESDYIGLSQSRTGVFRVQHSLGDWFAPSAITTDTISRLTIVCDTHADIGSTAISLYQDGELTISLTFSEVMGDITSGTVKLGASRSGVTTLNQQLKNFKILPYAASADEVKSWGAPK